MCSDFSLDIAVSRCLHFSGVCSIIRRSCLCLDRGAFGSNPHAWLNGHRTFEIAYIPQNSRSGKLRDTGNPEVNGIR